MTPFSAIYGRFFRYPLLSCHPCPHSPPCGQQTAMPNMRSPYSEFSRQVILLDNISFSPISAPFSSPFPCLENIFWESFFHIRKQKLHPYSKKNSKKGLTWDTRRVTMCLRQGTPDAPNLENFTPDSAGWYNLACQALTGRETRRNGNTDRE